MKKLLRFTVMFALCATLGISACEKQPSRWENLESFFGFSTTQKAKRKPEEIMLDYQIRAQREQNQKKDLPCNWDEESHDKLVELRQQWSKETAPTFWGRPSLDSTILEQ